MVLMPDGHVMRPVSHSNMTAMLQGGQGSQGLPGEAVRQLASHIAGGLNVTGSVEKDVEEVELFWDGYAANEWVILFMVVVALLCFDALLDRVGSRFEPRGHKRHAAMVIWWIVTALVYNICFTMRAGEAAGMKWLIGYALEWMLSLDNVFVVKAVIRTFAAPQRIQHKALFFGIVGSILSRLFLFLIVGYVIHSVHYVQLVFGFFLMYAGVQALVDDDDEYDPRESLIVRILKRALGDRLQERYDLENYRLFVWDQDGRMCATLLVPLILSVEFADFIFAVDSVSAKVAQIPDQFICYSSSVLAMLGTRALFFVMEDLVKFFEMLKYGVSFIMMFIGTELMVASKYTIPDWFVCVVVITVFNVCIVASILRQLILDDRATSTPRPSHPSRPPRRDAKTDSSTAASDVDYGGSGRGSSPEGSHDLLPDLQFASQGRELRQHLERRYRATEASCSPNKRSRSPGGTADSAAG